MISIIIPVHNGAQFIERAVKSVKSQEGDWELIFVNDHSTDETSEILSRCTVDCSRIVIGDSQERGVTEARMTGARKASGEYLFFMDVDDELPPNVIKSMSEIIGTDKDVDMVIGDIVEKRSLETKEISYGQKEFNHGSQLFDWIIDNRIGYLWGKAIRRELFLSIPYVPSELRFCEDYVQMLQLTLFAEKIRHIGAHSYTYYQNPQSACNSVKSKTEYSNQFYDLSAALSELVNLIGKKGFGKHAIERMEVMFLYYARLYLAVAGTWGSDPKRLKGKYRAWMLENSLQNDILYDRKRRYQTIISFIAPRLVAMFYVPVLRFIHHRIK